MKASYDYYNITTNNINNSISNAKRLLKMDNRSNVMVGLNTDVFWQFYKNEKSEFDKVCLLAYLAIKSILGKKAYCKITNDFWYSRMSGHSHTIDGCFDSPYLLPIELRNYCNDYQARKIKFILDQEWHVVNYGKQMRGFYVSMKLNHEQLITQAELKRKSYQMKKYKAMQKEAFDKVIRKLNS